RAPTLPSRAPHHEVMCEQRFFSKKSPSDRSESDDDRRSEGGKGCCVVYERRSSIGVFVFLTPAKKAVS
ncbi:hypothetical protein, partial [Pyramidobacter sp.]|uniref:hypothetical protein n=1 Tax=Pyramidobacter sp. TaxID=1943581 RepID=UPI002A762C77